MEYSSSLVVTSHLLTSHLELSEVGFGPIWPYTTEIIIDTPICDNEISANIFARGLEASSSIEVLQFRGDASVAPLKAISAYLKSPTCRITALVFRETNWNEEWAEVLLEVLASNKSISTLKLKRINNLSQETVRALCILLTTSTTIEALSLKGNVFREEQLADALQKNTSLQKLDLSSCCIEDTGCLHIADALKTNKTLRVLDLSFNSFSMKGLGRAYMMKYEGMRCSGHEALKELLIENDVLEELSIEGCDTDFEDVRHICEALERNTTLTNLRIERAKYCKEERKRIEQYVRRNANSRRQYYVAILLRNILGSNSPLPIEIWIAIFSYVFPDFDGYNEFALDVVRNA